MNAKNNFEIIILSNLFLTIRNLAGSQDHIVYNLDRSPALAMRTRK